MDKKWDDAIIQMQGFIYYLIEDHRFSLCLISQVSGLNLKDLRNVIRFRSPNKDLTYMMKTLLKFQEFICDFKKEKPSKDIYQYLVDRFSGVDNSLYLESPDMFEPADYSEKHGGDVCRIS